MWARVGFKPSTFWTQGPESTTEPPCPVHCVASYLQPYRHAVAQTGRTNRFSENWNSAGYIFKLLKSCTYLYILEQTSHCIPISKIRPAGRLQRMEDITKDVTKLLAFKSLLRLAVIYLPKRVVPKAGYSSSSITFGYFC